MDALLIALLGCLLPETGDKGQLLAHALAERFRRDGAVIAGIVAAALANAALGAAAGAFIAPLLRTDGRPLFLALALVFLAAGRFWPTIQQIGSAACRDIVSSYVSTSGDAAPVQ